MKLLLLVMQITICAVITSAQNFPVLEKNIVVAKGKMPNATTDKKSNVHIVYGVGDSIMYLNSTNKGQSFSSPSLVAVLPGLFASAMRGPQIAATSDGIVVTACTNKGNIYSYRKQNSKGWTNALKVNDEDEVAKEALMSLSADGYNVFAVWLAAKKIKGQTIYGASSADGGLTWKNLLVYASPESTVCECCKPSVAVEGNHVFVMFRNFLTGNRDLYLSKSINGGKSFEDAQKLGVGNWKLNGCPMDGGGLAIDTKGNPQTVWRREGKIYTSTIDMPEIEVGEGKGCTLELVNNKKVYGWAENGDIVITKPHGERLNLGKGSQPIIKALGNNAFICIWERDRDIHTSVIEL